MRQSTEEAIGLARRKHQTDLTEYGATVLALALERGITTQLRLAEVLDDQTAENVTQPRMSNWLRGVYDPPWWFNDLLAETLELSEDDMRKLAWANTYGKRTPKRERGTV